MARMMRPLLVALLASTCSWCCLANITQAMCLPPARKWSCDFGCYDSVAARCSTNLTTEQQCQAANASGTIASGSYLWAESCNCQCKEYVCDFGCYDSEDEACHEGLDQNGCAEIYGHVQWSQKCSCRFQGEDYVPRGANARQAVNIYFSVPAFVVLFRESLEVVIILVIIVQFLTKSKEDGMIREEQFYRFRREVYVGAGLGFCCCLIMGMGFLALASLFRGLLKGDNLRIFDGIMMLITAFVLSFLALNFYKMIHTKEGHERKMRQQLSETLRATGGPEQGDLPFGKKHSFFTLAFVTGLREGLESIIFLVGVVGDLKDLSSLPLPICLALVLARVAGCIFFQSTKKMRVDWFMRVSAIFLLFIAAGFFSSSMHKWQELGAFGTWSPKSEREWINSRVFDATGCCNDKTNRFFVLMRALLGWQDQPTPLEFFAYAVYWVLAIVPGVFLVRLAKRQMEVKKAQWREEEQKEKQDAKLSDEPAEGNGVAV